MGTLNSIECFVRSAEAGSFSGAARRLGLTPAAVSKNVANLEKNLGVRLFQRSTRSLKLSEAGERFLKQAGGGLASIQNAIANLSSANGQPAGTLKVSFATSIGRAIMLPLLKQFMQLYPAVVPDWRFDNRQIDLIAEGYDAAIGGGIDFPSSLVARELAPAHLLLVASPAYMQGRAKPSSPADLSALDGIMWRSPQSGRIREWALRTHSGEQVIATPQAKLILSDPEAACYAAIAGIGVAAIGPLHALPFLQDGSLVRLLPDWYGDLGPILLYFGTQLPAKTRVFIDFVVAHFRTENLAARWSAQHL